MSKRRSSRLPWLTRMLLRTFLRRDAAARALADLEDVHARVVVSRGRLAAAWLCVREALLIVGWAWFGRVPDDRSARGPHAPASGGWEAVPAGVLRGSVEDVRFGLRTLARRPGFTALTVLVLALGIGANVTIFTLANRLFLAAPAAVEAPDELVRLFRSWAPGQGGALSYPDYLDYRAGATQLSGIMAYGPSGVAVTARWGADPGPARAWPVSDNYFDVLGVEPALGRFFTAEENVAPGTHPVVVLSHGYWARTLGADPDVLGREVRLNGTSFTVIGIAPDEFRGLGPNETVPDLFIPILMRNAIVPSGDTAWRERLPDLRENWLGVVGRLAAGASFESARAELVTIAARIAELHPQHNEGESVHVSRQFRYYPATGRTLSGITRMLLAVVLLVLAIASANAAILLLSRSSARARELGIRAAIGAGRGRVVRLLLTESLLLGLAGGALGVLLSVWGSRAAGAMLPVPVPDASPDAIVLLFALAVSILTSVLVGLAPALRASRADVTELINARGRSGRGSPLQAGLVVVQIALSLVLVTGATLFTRSLTAARTQDIGFTTDRGLLVEINLRNHGYDADRGRTFLSDATDRIAGLPGVERVTTLRMVPFQGEWTTTLTPWTGAGFDADLELSLDAVSPGFFTSMRMPIVRGRPLDERDRAGSLLAVVINETLAAATFPDADPIGQLFPVRGENQPAFTVVGVSRNATYHRLGEPPVARAYAAMDQVFQLWFTLLIRTDGDPLERVASVRDVIRDIDPDIALADVTTLAAVFDQEIARFRVTARMVGLFGSLALALAAAGLYGVLSFFVLRRGREIGVCIALGATRRRIAQAVLRRGLGLALAGIAIGMTSAFALARLVGSLLYETPSRDPLSFAIAPLVLLVVAVLAVLIPVRRAMAIDPMRAIRTD